MVKGFLQKIKIKLAKEPLKRIVFPEATDIRILGAASQLAEEGLLVPILLGDINMVNDIATKHHVNISRCEVLNPKSYIYFSEMVDTYMKCRKVSDYKEAVSLLRNLNYFGTMLVQMGKADGLVSGA